MNKQPETQGVSVEEWEKKLNEIEDNFPMALESWSVEDWKKHIRKILHTHTLATEEREAYLWFDAWYSHYKAPCTSESVEDFGKWATERLQEHGAKRGITLSDSNLEY